jgi:hypothetical protein
MRTKRGITVRLYEEKVSKSSAVIMLVAAWGETMRANPTRPEMSMAKPTGMLVKSRPKRRTQPIRPICKGVTAL